MASETGLPLTRAFEFAKRLHSAADTHPDCPPMNKGRLVWTKDQLNERFKTSITMEGARKWFAGEAVPRGENGKLLAQVFAVDYAWLILGVDPGLDRDTKVARDAMADGMVNVVAGLIQMDGGNIAFPKEGDRDAKERGIHLYAIIRGARYTIHVAAAEKLASGRTRFFVPLNRTETIVITAVRSKFRFEFFEIDERFIAKHGRRRGNTVEIDVKALDTGFRKIESFVDRI